MKHTIKGSFRFLTEGRDGKVYPKEVIRKAVEEFQETLKTKWITGEIEPPDDMVIDMQNVTHMVTGLRCDENLDYEIDIDTLPTYKGKLVDEFLKLDIMKAGARMTGGDEGLEIITFDIVDKR